MNDKRLHYTRPEAADVPRLLAACGSHPLGTEICTALRTDGAESDRLWVGRDEAGTPRCVVYDGPAYKLTLSERTAAVGRHDPGAAGIFSPPRRGARFYVLQKKDAAAAPETAEAERLTGSEIRALYLLLASGQAMPAPLERSYVYAVRCANRGLSEVYAIREGGKPVSGAEIMAKNDVYALIGNLFTDPAHRGRGLAAAVLTACETAAAKEGRIPVLYCERAMLPYYRARGYERIKPHGL